jgi:RNA exonuclease 1
MAPVLALDCEMCETTDPVSGEVDLHTLVRLSVVSSVEPDNVLLDILVRIFHFLKSFLFFPFH